MQAASQVTEVERTRGHMPAAESTIGAIQRLLHRGGSRRSRPWLTAHPRPSPEQPRVRSSEAKRRAWFWDGERTPSPSTADPLYLFPAFAAVQSFLERNLLGGASGVGAAISSIAAPAPSSHIFAMREPVAKRARQPLAAGNHTLSRGAGTETNRRAPSSSGATCHTGSTPLGSGSTLTKIRLGTA